MVFKMMAVLNEFEQDQIAERTTSALAYKKANGEKYSPTPFGFQSVAGRLVKDDAEVAILAEVKEQRAGGATLRAIASDMNRRRMPTKKGGKWCASTISYFPKRGATEFCAASDKWHVA